jgi:predicted dehydrogenase
MNQKVRLGMVGGGQGAFIGAVHRHAIGMDGQYELVAGAFSRQSDNNAQTAAQLGIDARRAYASWQDMLALEAALPEDQRIQAITIVTPNATHVPIAIAAAKAGLHVMCEKPLGVSSAEAKDLAHTLKASNTVFALAHTYIGYPMVWQARHMVAEGVIGKVRKILVEYPQGWLTDYIEGDNKQAAWRTDPKESGASGCMGDIGTHAYNLAEFVSGHHIDRLSAMLNTVVDGRHLDDDGAAHFRTAQGASGTLIASQVCAGEENAPKVRVYGEKGGLLWTHAEPNTLVHMPHGAPKRILRAGSGMPELCEQANSLCRTPGGHPEGYLEAFANLYTLFAEQIRQQPRAVVMSAPGIEAGLRGMAFIDAMLASAAADSKWVNI